MTGFASKRQAAWNKFANDWKGTEGWGSHLVDAAIEAVRESVAKKDYVNMTLRQPPQPVGYWVLYTEVMPQTKFAMYHKPTDYQIYNTEQLLGWKWQDA